MSISTPVNVSDVMDSAYAALLPTHHKEAIRLLRMYRVLDGLIRTARMVRTAPTLQNLNRLAAALDLIAGVD